jgi:hypothetical protein
MIEIPGTVPEKHVLIKSWPFSHARIHSTPNDGSTSNQTGQLSEMTPTRSPNNRPGWKNPLSLVPSLSELTRSSKGAAKAGPLSGTSFLIRQPLPQEGLIFLQPCPKPSWLLSELTWLPFQPLLHAIPVFSQPRMANGKPGT